MHRPFYEPHPSIHTRQSGGTRVVMLMLMMMIIFFLLYRAERHRKSFKRACHRIMIRCRSIIIHRSIAEIRFDFHFCSSDPIRFSSSSFLRLRRVGDTKQTFTQPRNEM